MSRTRRKDKEGNVFWDGRRTEEVNHRCRCEYCTGFDKRKIEDRVLDNEMQIQIKQWYGNERLEEEWWELTSSEWERRDKEFIQEWKNWEQYKS